MIRILHVLSQMGYGGVSTQLYKLYKKIDKGKIHFDFVVHGSFIGGLEKLVEQEGSKVYHVTPKKESFIKNFKEIDYIIKKGNYDEVFAHQNFSSFSVLFSAMGHGVPVRVAYARGAIKNENLSKKLRNIPFRIMVKMFSNYRWAITEDAGIWVYGRNWKKNGRNIVFKDSVDTERFVFNSEEREKTRNKIRLDELFVILMVGRFSPEKNHMFALNVFEKLLMLKANAVLLLVGEGGEKDKIREEVKKRGLIEKVIFYGTTDKPENLMNAADVLIFPSKHEGFGDVAIEAQCCGLPVIASDRIPIETKATDIISYLSIDGGNGVWVDEILKVNTDIRVSKTGDIQEKGFDLKSQAGLMEKLMVSYYKERT